MIGSKTLRQARPLQAGASLVPASTMLTAAAPVTAHAARVAPGGMTLAAALGHNAAAVGEPRTYGLEFSYDY